MSESVLCPVLIGRANELALFEDLLRRAADGTGRAAVVTGDGVLIAYYFDHRGGHERVAESLHMRMPTYYRRLRARSAMSGWRRVSATERRPSRPEVDNEGALRTYKVDLHGHDLLTAVDLAQDRVQEAYSNGYEAVELLHGAGDVSEPVETGRGRIKWALRKLVEEGRLDGYIDRGRTWLKAGSIVLYLKRNPQARRESWSPDPPRSHR